MLRSIYKTSSLSKRVLVLKRTITKSYTFKSVTNALPSYNTNNTHTLVNSIIKLPSHEVLKMPALSPTMTKGNIAQWKLKIGDKVSPGIVETDKAVVDFESQEDGFLAKILLPDGSSDIEINEPVAVICENAADVAKFADYKAGAAAPEPKAAAVAPTQAASTSSAQSSAAPTQASTSNSGRVSASPLAQSLAASSGISLSGVTGSGPNSRVIKADVLEHLEAKKSTAAQPVASKPKAAVSTADEGGYKDIPHTNMRKVIAERLLASKLEIPHFYLTVECKVDNLLKLREQLNQSAKSKISINDFIVKASALSLRAEPKVNASWRPDCVRQFDYVDISVAVSTDSGLITPIVRDADLKGLATISADVKLLAEKAKANKLTPNEFQGGTFTISNLGMFGVDTFSAIINPPQAAILAIGGTSQKVVATKEGGFATANVMNVTLSCDHRVVDGALGALWLKSFKGYIENPTTMLL